MPRSPTTRRSPRPQSEPSLLSRKGVRHRPLNAYIVLAFVLIGGYWAWAVWQTNQLEEGFSSLVAAGQGSLKMVEAIEIEDRGAGTASESYRYRSDPPTSGRHHPETIAPGYYEDHQIESRLVNALEHGNIVIYYGEVDPAVRTNLRRWAVFYGANEWAGLVVVPKPQIGKSVILTAWGHKLTLGPFDPAASAAFVDKYRGRGPENRVR